MNNKITLLAVAAALSSSAQLHAKAHDHQSYQFTDKEIASLKLNSLLTIDDQHFVFNNALLNEDWDYYFDQYAPALKDKQTNILHWAGFYSINPKVILALIEQQSGLLSDSSVDIDSALASLSTQTSFDQQLKDVVGQLSERFYAYKQWHEKRPKPDKKVHSKIETTSLQAQSEPLATNAATVALTSVLHANQHTQSVKTNAQNQWVDPLADFLAAFEKLAPSVNTVTANDDNVVQASVRSSVNFTMNLPWPSGNYWYSGGAHSNTGSGYPYSSLDFNNGSGGWGSNTPWVQAAHGGTVTRFSSCNIRVTHASGFSTNYYHMSDLQYSSGDYVQPGTWLGRYANSYNQALCEGGQSSGPHVHFTLLYNGVQTSLHNRYISGHRIDVGNSNYDDNCYNFYFERYGYKTCAWQPLYN